MLDIRLLLLWAVDPRPLIGTVTTREPDALRKIGVHGSAEVCPKSLRSR